MFLRLENYLTQTLENKFAVNARYINMKFMKINMNTRKVLTFSHFDSVTFVLNFFASINAS